MAEEYEACPKFWECCPAEFTGNDDEAKKNGWRLGWDGWICGKCNESPTRTDCPTTKFRDDYDADTGTI